ncbi:hypothetical protein ACS0TY_003543 [Phlomoides rotata]
MATVNPFDLLGDDAEDPSLLAQKVEPKKTEAPSKPVAGAKQVVAQPKLPTKTLPPARAVRESKPDSARGGRGGGRGYSRGRGAGAGGGSYRDSTPNENSYGNREVSAGQGASDEADAGKPYERRGGYGGPRGGRRGGFSNGELGEGDRPRRPYDRRSGTGQGYILSVSFGLVPICLVLSICGLFARLIKFICRNDIKREGAGRGNWGTQTDELAQVAEGVFDEGEKGLGAEKPSGEDDAAVDGEKEAAKTEVEEKEKEPEDKEMTLEEYEKVLEEKRKALQALKTESSRKVDVKEFETMQQLSNKKANDDIFIKLSSDKDKKKELAEKEERAKKSVSINEFLKPADGDKYYNPGGRGRGRGRGGFRGGYGGGSEMGNARAPSIEDPGQFPTLAGK